MGHEGVTRRLTVIGRARKQQAFVAEPKIELEKEWRRENLSAVVFLQDRSSYRILGAAKIALMPVGRTVLPSAGAPARF